MTCSTSQVVTRVSGMMNVGVHFKRQRCKRT